MIICDNDLRINTLIIQIMSHYCNYFIEDSVFGSDAPNFETYNGSKKFLILCLLQNFLKLVS